MEIFAGIIKARLIFASVMQKLAALNLGNYRVLLHGSRSPISTGTPRSDSDWDLLLVPVTNPIRFTEAELDRPPRKKIDEIVMAAVQVLPNLERTLKSLAKTGFFRSKHKKGPLKSFFEKWRGGFQISIKVMVRTPEGWGWVYAIEKDKEAIHNNRLLLEKDYRFLQDAVFLDELFEAIESGKQISPANLPS